MIRQKVAFSSRIGDRWTFAIEFEGIGDPPKAWNEWWGSLWLWVDGHVVGRPSEIEMVMTGFDSLVGSAQQTRTGLSTPLQLSVAAEEALDLVMWARYGSDDRAPGSFVGDPSALKRYEVLPRLTGPFFDGWEAVLIEAAQQERFILRQEGADVREALWPAGTFRSVVQLALDDFKRFAVAGSRTEWEIGDHRTRTQ
jgi:hypothetical protein